MVIILYLSVLIGGLALLVFALSLIGHKRYEKRVEQGTAKPEETSPFEVTKEVPQECCGQHATCERDYLLAAVSKEIIYYDDEELDAYKGIASDEYTEEQTNQFAEIFYELKEVEVAGDDGRFVNTDAEAKGTQLTIKSPISAPVKIRYAWKDCPVATLYGKNGLPAVPFEYTLK